MKASKRSKIWVFALVTGCRLSIESPCEKHLGRHEFDYFGEVVGSGEFVLSVSGEGATVAHITLVDRMGSEAKIEISGPAECMEDAIRVRFGPGDHAKSAYQVAGGTFSVTRDPLAFDWFFGAWSTQVLHKESGIKGEMQGFLRQRFAAESPALP